MMKSQGLFFCFVLAPVSLYSNRQIPSASLELKLLFVKMEINAFSCPTEDRRTGMHSGLEVTLILQQ